MIVRKKKFIVTGTPPETVDTQCRGLLLPEEGLLTPQDPSKLRESLLPFAGPPLALSHSDYVLGPEQATKDPYVYAEQPRVVLLGIGFT